MFDTFILNSLIEELNHNLLSYRLQRVLSPGPMSYILRFRKDRQLLLHLDPSRCFAALAGDEVKETDSPTPFSIYLRRNLQNAKLISIKQRAFDRVMELSFLASTPTFDKRILKLIIELMGRHSNMILTDENDRIIQALKYTPHLSETQHIIRIGKTYRDMETGKEDPLSSSLASTNYKEASGFTPKLMRLLPDEIKALNLSEISNWLIRQNRFSLYLDPNGNPYDFHRFENPTLSFVSFPTVSSLILSYYQTRSRQEHSLSHKRRFEQIINTRIERVERKLQKQRRELDQAMDADSLKQIGDILLSSLHLLPKRGNQVEVYDYYSDEMRNIELNDKFSVSQNAQQYYKRYEKAKRAKSMIEEQLENSQQEYRRLEQLRFDLSLSTDYSDLRLIEQELIHEGYLPKTNNKPSVSVSKPRRFEYLGAVYLVGKNASQNNEITFRTKDRSFLWFHAKDIPGSHVILLQSEEDSSSDQLLFGAKLAAYFSRDHQTRVQVDYTQLKYVKKHRGANLGNVYYTNQRSILTDVKASEILIYEKV